jgi:hypothetical protein
MSEQPQNNNTTSTTNRLLIILILVILLGFCGLCMVSQIGMAFVDGFLQGFGG